MIVCYLLSPLDLIFRQICSIGWITFRTEALTNEFYDLAIILPKNEKLTKFPQKVFYPAGVLPLEKDFLLKGRYDVWDFFLAWAKNDVNTFAIFTILYMKWDLLLQNLSCP